MKFAFDTDEVLRDTVGKMKAIYEKFFIDDYVYEEGEEKFEYKVVEPVDTYDFQKHFLFPNESEFINFLYFDFPMNICGHAPSVTANTFNVFSEIQKNTLKKKDKISVISKAIAKQKPASLFFFSKYGLEVDEVFFYNKKNLSKVWTKYDVIVTANPDLLECKPKNKKSVKFETEYNKNVKSDFTIKSLEDFTSIYKEL